MGGLFVPKAVGKGVVARVAAELSRRHVSTLVMHLADPIVKPRVRLFTQYDGRWGSFYLRGPGQRNTFDEAGDKGAAGNPAVPQVAKSVANDGWKDNGCYPTCIAMVVRWWAEDHAETKGLLQYPFAGAKEALDPIEVCRRLYGRPYVPCVQAVVPEGLQGNRKVRGFNDYTREWNVNQVAILNGFCAITRAPRAFEGGRGSAEQAMVEKSPELGGVSKRYYLLHKRMATAWQERPGKFVVMDHEQRRAALKSALQYGPAVVCLQFPGHFVVVDGYRGHTISICDPGAVLTNPNDWDTLPSRRTGDLPAGAAAEAGYVAIDDQKAYQAHGEKFNDKWLMQITSIDQFYAGEDDVHAEWSNLEVTT